MLLTLLNKFWLVVFFYSNNWRSDLTGDSARIWLYIYYPVSYSEELINLCWYCWGGGLYPSLGHPRVSSLSEIFTTVVQQWTVHVHYNWSDLLLDKNVITHQPNQFSLQYLHQQRKNCHDSFDSSIFISTHKSARQVFDGSHHWTEIHVENLIPPDHRPVILLKWSLLIYFMSLQCCFVFIVKTIKFPY